MVQVDQHRHRLAYDLVRLLALDVDHKPTPQASLFELRVIQALLGRRPAGSACAWLPAWSDSLFKVSSLSYKQHALVALPRRWGDRNKKRYENTTVCVYSWRVGCQNCAIVEYGRRGDYGMNLVRARMSTDSYYGKHLRSRLDVKMRKAVHAHQCAPSRMDLHDLEVISSGRLRA